MGEEGAFLKKGTLFPYAPISLQKLLEKRELFGKALGVLGVLAEFISKCLRICF
jgi:hypothetical protein